MHPSARVGELLLQQCYVDGKWVNAAMIKVLQDRDLRSKMASANQERIRIFEPGAVAEEYLEVLQSVVREAKPTP